MKTLVTAFFVALAVGLVGVVSAPVRAQDEDNAAKLVGKPFEFSMKTLDGMTVTHADFEGKVVLVDFWATWCGPCKKAAPFMQELHAMFEKDGLVVIGANTWEETEGPKPAADYAKEHGFTYLFTYGNDKMVEALGLGGVPTFILIGRDGKVAWTKVGFTEEWKDEFTTAVKTALSAQ